jgi:hypothetical protein
MKLTSEQARRAMVAAQSLGAGGTITDVLERTGFVRTLGGIDVYLALRARIPTLARADLDVAAANGEVQIVPAVRGCMYLVPRAHVPLALRVAELLSSGRAEREHAKAGIRPGEVDELGHAVLEALGARSLSTDAVRKALPEGAVRSLGPAGKKVGVSSPLPAALRRLEFSGAIERRPEGGRLDTERYVWRRTQRNPVKGAAPAAADLYASLGEIFFRAAGVGDLREFAAWAGITQREAKAAAETLDLAPVEVEGRKAPHFMLQSEQDRLLAAPEAGIAFLAFEDNLLALHGGPAALVDDDHHDMPVPSWGMSRAVTLGEARHMALRCVVADSHIAALWEYDPAARQVVLGGLGASSRAHRVAMEKAAKDLAAFIREDLGHALSHSLDTEDALAERARAVETLAGG